MKKIPSLFKRDYAGNRLVFDEVVEGCEWVREGEGEATQKHDGTCCFIKNGQFYKRYELKKGKTPPPDFITAQESDPFTGDTPGWVSVKPEDRWHWSAFRTQEEWEPQGNGTYELCGPKINGNPENLIDHRLIKHGSVRLPGAPRTFDELRAYFKTMNIEGIVWWRDPLNPNCEKVKIKQLDFGLQRGLDALNKGKAG